MQAYFDTLNEALAAEGLVDLWPLGTNINYGQTVALDVEQGKVWWHISVYRNDEGRYERPIWYRI